LVDFVKAHPPASWDGFYERFGRPTLNALAFAYSRNIIHRDVKPQNVLLDDQKNVKVADFGIAKLRKYYRSGVTLTHFRSVRYAPEIERVEVITRGAQRRWSMAEKRAIVAESLEPGAVRVEICRRHDISSGQLSTWRQQCRADARDNAGALVPTFARAMVMPIVRGSERMADA
jgi:transposase-like protein